MFAVSVPGSSVPGPEIPDVVVFGSGLDVVDALVTAGVSSIVLACSADALRHAMRRARDVGTLMIVDARGREDIPVAVFDRVEDLRRSTVIVWGASCDPDTSIARHAARVLWCCDGVSPRALANLVATRRPRLHAAA